jgi:hypothetical protein
MKIRTCLLLSFALALGPYASASQVTNCVTIITNINLEFGLVKPSVAGCQSEFKADEMIDSLLYVSGTNDIYLRKFPSSTFEFHLFDEKGIEVPKTKAGLALTGTPPLPKTYDDIVDWRRRGFVPFVVDKSGRYAPLFCPENIFLLTKKGTYELEVKMRLCVIMTNGMPDVAAMLDGRNATRRGLPFIADFGVLTSPPLRVRIIKK